MNEINTKADSYNVTVNPLLTSPWESASTKSLEFKTLAEGYLTGLLNDETGIVTFATTATTNLKSPFEAGSEAAKLFASTIGFQLGAEGAGGYVVSFGTNNYGKLDGVFNSGKTAAGLFTSAVNTGIESIKTTVYNSTSPLTSNLKFPWNDTTKTDGPISTFSTKAKGAVEGAVTTAQQKASAMKTALTSPWTEGTNAANTFSTNVGKALDEAIRVTKEKVATLNAEGAKYNPPSYTGNGTTTTTTPTTKPTSGSSYNANVKVLQQILNDAFQISPLIKEDGYLGPDTETAIKQAQQHVNRYFQAQVIFPDGIYDNETRNAFLKYLTSKIDSWKASGSSSAVGQGVQAFTEYKNKLPKAFAKGTTGTTKDQWAYTDEPWLGDEIVLVPGKNGNLQYMRKGTAVMPADISENLMEWGKINPDMSNIAKGVHGVNLMSNYVSKPEINLTFDALVKADNITEDTLPEVKKFVQQEINSLVKQMNYALKGYSR